MKVERTQRSLLLLPAIILSAGVVAFPLLRVLFLSFTTVDPWHGLEAHWAGLAPYRRLWQDGRFLLALGNTVRFTIATVALETVLGIVFALVLSRPFRGRGVVRAAVLLPWALPTAVMALGWAWIFNDSFGVANDLLIRCGLLSRPVAWLAEPGTAFAAIVIADVWKTTPFVALVVLSGLQGIPEELHDAAEIDGASAVQRFFRITLPLLTPAILVAAVFRTIQAFGAFDLIYVMTGGGPGGSTETVALYSYQNYFRYLDFGYGSTVAVQGALLLLATAGAVMLSARRRGEP